MIKIRFDTREKKLLDYWSKFDNDPLFQNKEVTNLDVGDIQIFHENKPEEILVLIERKTLTDLAASIRDGRYKEQLLRLKSLPKITRIFYILEGCCMNKHDITRVKQTRKLKKIGHGNLTGEALYSAYLNIQIRDNFHVIESDNLEETKFIIERMVKQIEKKYQEMINNNEVTPHLEQVEEHNYHYTQNLKISKKGNINSQVCYINILTQIPGISSNMASFICEKYPTMAKLVNSYNEISLDDDKDGKLLKKRMMLLKNIEVKLDSGKVRKVGPVVSGRIYTYLFGNEDENKEIEKE